MIRAMLLNLIPKVFYEDINVGLDLFVRCLGFTVLHPNSSTIQPKPWGTQEFAVLDATTLCVVFRQWT